MRYDKRWECTKHLGRRKERRERNLLLKSLDSVGSKKKVGVTRDEWNVTKEEL